VVLLFGARSVEDLAYQGLFDRWRTARVEVLPTLSRPKEGSWTGRVGYAHSALAEVRPAPDRTSAFLAGGKDFSTAMTEALTALGVAPGRIFRNF
jgi:NAD(P)H-flavin reductase